MRLQKDNVMPRIGYRTGRHEALADRETGVISVRSELETQMTNEETPSSRGIARFGSADLTPVESLERFLEAAPNTTRALGEFLQRVGEFELAAGRSMDSLATEFTSRGGIEAFVKLAPPDVVSKFLQVMVRAARLGAPDLTKMTADQKVTAGREMKELADDMKELFDAMRSAGLTPQRQE